MATENEQMMAAELVEQQLRLALLVLEGVEAIALAASIRALLLMKDNRARKVAGQLGVVVFNIPAFLFAVKESQFLDRTAMGSLVTSLIEKDHYGFRLEILSALLS